MVPYRAIGLLSVRESMLSTEDIQISITPCSSKCHSPLLCLVDNRCRVYSKKCSPRKICHLKRTVKLLMKSRVKLCKMGMELKFLLIKKWPNWTWRKIIYRLYLHAGGICHVQTQSQAVQGCSAVAWPLLNTVSPSWVRFSVGSI